MRSSHPLHPYTRGLIGSVPSHGQRGTPLTQIPGMAPSLAHLPPGCAFAPRCARADERLRHDAGAEGAQRRARRALLAPAPRNGRRTCVALILRSAKRVSKDEGVRSEFAAILRDARYAGSSG